MKRRLLSPFYDVDPWFFRTREWKSGSYLEPIKLISNAFSCDKLPITFVRSWKHLSIRSYSLFLQYRGAFRFNGFIVLINAFSIVNVKPISVDEFNSLINISNFWRNKIADSQPYKVDFTNFLPFEEPVEKLFVSIHAWLSTDKTNLKKAKLREVGWIPGFWGFHKFAKFSGNSIFKFLKWRGRLSNAWVFHSKNHPMC